MQSVQPNKGYGQHFLKDTSVVHTIVNTLKMYHQSPLLIEVGPGTGALTSHLIPDFLDSLQCIEVDQRCVDFLHSNFPILEGHIIHEDFLNVQLDHILTASSTIIGNFPYNISSQIVFKVLEYREKIPLMVGMFQKEVADRIASPHGKKTYGILSVLTQLHFDTEVVFDIPPSAFNPPPKVMSSVLVLRRKETETPVNYTLFRKVVKAAFNQRRKMLRNSLKQLAPAELQTEDIFTLRPEQLSVQDFVDLTNRIEALLS